MKTYDLVVLAKQKQGIESDRQFALKNGFSAQNVVDWKAEKANASTANYIRLARCAGLTLDEMEELANELEKRKNVRQAGYSDIQTMLGLSGLSLLAVTGITYYPQLALRIGTGLCILC